MKKKPETNKSLTKTALIAKLKALGDISIEQKRSIVCSLIGHSKIISMCFGYVYCGRCGDQLGDTLASVYDTTNNVIIGHKCKTCLKNSKSLTWRDKFLVEKIA